MSSVNPQGLIPMLIQRRLLIKTDLRRLSPLKPHTWEPSMEVTLAVVNILSTHQWVGTALLVFAITQLSEDMS